MLEDVTVWPMEASTSAPGGGDDSTVTSAVTGVVVFGLVIIFLIILKRRQSHRHSASVDLDPISHDDDDVNVQYFDYWENISDESKGAVEHVMMDIRRLTMGKLLGEGQFGCVYEAALDKSHHEISDYSPYAYTNVAVKTLKGSADINTDKIERFLQEVLIMKDFKHNNVLELIGVALGDHGIPMIVLPLMTNGSLKAHISDVNVKLTVRHLLKYGMDVAAGMQYLANNKFVHRDLATRNCMLDDNMEVKVADFGLSRDIDSKDYYCSADKQAKLPVKWMALESLTKSVYTSKSDVWSYGVLLWELLTRGCTPYPDVNSWDVIAYIQEGRRMRQPDACPLEMYELMLLCWQSSPEKRPTFQDIITEIESMLTDDTDSDEEEDDDLYINVNVV